MASTMNAHDSSNQVLFTASAMFAAIVAAVVVSTLLVMTLMKGEFASAVSKIQNKTTTPLTLLTTFQKLKLLLRTIV